MIMALGRLIGERCLRGIAIPLPALTFLSSWFVPWPSLTAAELHGKGRWDTDGISGCLQDPGIDPAPS